MPGGYHTGAVGWYAQVGTHPRVSLNCLTLSTTLEHTHKGKSMTTTTIDSLIAAFALAMIVVPIIILGIQDARRHPWKPTNKHKRFGVDSDYMKAVRGGSKALAEYHRKALADGLERRKW